jgi:hypothetical protein
LIVPNLRATTTDPTLFLSYSHHDSEIVRRIARDLSGRGVRVWLDEAALLLGDRFVDKIHSVILDIGNVAVVLSQRSVRSTWVRDEVEITIAAGTERADGGPKLVLLKIDDCEIPDDLTGREIIDLVDAESYQTSIDFLVGRLKSAGDSGSAAGRAADWPAPEEAFAPVRVIKFHAVFHDGTEFVFGRGRIVTSCDTRVDALQSMFTPEFYGLGLDRKALETARLAHFESRTWLRGQRTLADEGIRSGDHIIVTSSTAAGIDAVADAFAKALATTYRRQD